MKPYITCFMYASVDGHIDCDMTEKIDPAAKSYYDVLKELGPLTNINGRVTRYTHNALPSQFKSYSNERCGKCFYKACDATSYEVCIDTNGSLMWGNNKINGIDIICIISENATIEYANYLKGKGISYIACGNGKVDLCCALDTLYKEFGVKKAVLTGGGHINSGFLNEGLIDELWIMYGPGIDGRKGLTSVFDGRDENSEPVKLKLKDVVKLEDNAVLIKYNF